LLAASSGDIAAENVKFLCQNFVFYCYLCGLPKLAPRLAALDFFWSGCKQAGLIKH